jgi:hypothetical protein
MRSFAALYRSEVATRLVERDPSRLVAERDLQRLPALIAHYLRRCGVVGAPQPRNVHAIWRGDMRRRHNAAWMPVTAEQHNFFDPPARVFLMRGRLLGLPFEGFHQYVGSGATMRVRVAGIFPVVNASGPIMTQSETVTMLNDLCLLAPAALIDADVRWDTLDQRRVRATFRNAGITISAILTFDESGDLASFTSTDRYQSSDGVTYQNYPWSTPVSDYRDYHGIRLPSRGEAIWTEPTGDFVYGRLTLIDARYNVAASSKSAAIADPERDPYAQPPASSFSPGRTHEP